MRMVPLLVVASLMSLCPYQMVAEAQTTSPSTPSQSSSGGNTVQSAPSGGTVSPQKKRMGAGKPSVGGTTQSDMREEKKNDKKMTICKGC
ncbi:hypothetical protein [Lichenihabitans psoromatis]|nr:hypothetical protein [Lichenihabitans psoromatis]